VDNEALLCWNSTQRPCPEHRSCSASVVTQGCDTPPPAMLAEVFESRVGAMLSRMRADIDAPNT
jgi:hypothetical protein